MTNQNVPDILANIIEYKKQEVKELLNKTSLSALEDLAKNQSKPRGFMNALINAAKTRPALIAEIKKASPSKGLIRADFDVANLANQYEQGGAACLSVLTDGPSFQGKNEYLEIARSACALPVLRKDFMIDIAQVFESRALGADCILIIMASTDDILAKELYDTAVSLGMDVLIETHNEHEMARAQKIGGILIGVNNRNLRNFEIDINTTIKLADMVDEDVFLIAESGIFTNQDLLKLQNGGAKGFLVGESLMRKQDVIKATKELLGYKMGNIDNRLKELGIELPNPPLPVASYVPFVKTGNQILISGQISITPEGGTKGKLGDLSIEDGQAAARICGLNLLAQLKAACGGDLDKVVRVVKLGGFVNALPNFDAIPAVINGCSDLMVEVFGDKGKHARSAVGVANLPLGLRLKLTVFSR